MNIIIEMIKGGIKMNTLTLNAWGSNHKITLHTNHYAENGNLYVGLVS